MIIWINGAFGSGKTQTAFELHRRIENSYVYDPENAGYFIWHNVPESLSGKGDFQDLPLWRSFNRELLGYISDSFEGTVIVPMTITNRSYYDEIIGGLTEKQEIVHCILYASRKTLLKRLSRRFEGKRSWAAARIDRCMGAFDRDEIPGHKLLTDHLSISQAAERVAELAGIELEPDRRSKIQKTAGRFITQLRHIR